MYYIKKSSALNKVMTPIDSLAFLGSGLLKSSSALKLHFKTRNLEGNASFMIPSNGQLFRGLVVQCDKFECRCPRIAYVTFLLHGSLIYITDPRPLSKIHP